MKQMVNVQYYTNDEGEPYVECDSELPFYARDIIVKYAPETDGWNLLFARYFNRLLVLQLGIVLPDGVGDQPTKNLDIIEFEDITHEEWESILMNI